MNDLKWDDLETFTAKGIRRACDMKPTVNLTTNGTIVFNKGFVSKNRELFDSKKYVAVSYSKKNQAIIFEFENILIKGKSLSVSKHPNNCSVYLNTFLKYNGLVAKEIGGTYLPELFYVPGKGKCWGILLKSKTKKCIKCGKEKTLDSFRVDKNGASGRRGTCKDCEKNKISP